MAIIFTKVKYKNFLSTGNNPIEMDLNEHATTIVVGRNGSGKSTLLDAITFALFGKPYRNINKPDLVNSINQRDCLVELTFDIGHKKYLVKRGLKPNIFEIYCNDILISQTAHNKDYQGYLEEHILHMGYKTFTQIDIIGVTSYVPFMQLSAQDRRNIIEDLLDIQIFSVMTVLTKQKLSHFRDKLFIFEKDISGINIELDTAQRYIDSIKISTEQKINEQNEELNKNKEYITNIQNTIRDIQTDITEIQSHWNDRDSNKEKYGQMLAFQSKIENRLKRVKKEIDFFREHESCPTCYQPISKEFSNNIIKQNSTKIDEFSTGLKTLLDKITAFETYFNACKEEDDKIDNLLSVKIKQETSMIEIEKYINRIEKELEELQTNMQSNDEEQNKLGNLKKKLKLLEEEKSDFLNNQMYYETIESLLKDTGIKTKIIGQYLPIINKLVNKYLETMDFFVGFTLDDKFKEIIKSRHRDEFSYENFSEGEKQRIDLALLFTWRNIAKMRNSISTNLLILDEIMDSSLDNDGIDGFLKILNTLEENTKVIVISHKEDIMSDKFKNIVRFEKVNNFSRINK